MIIFACLQYRLGEYAARDICRLPKSQCVVTTDPDRLRGLRGQEIYWVTGARHVPNVVEKEKEHLFKIMFDVMEMHVTKIILP